MKKFVKTFVLLLIFATLIGGLSVSFYAGSKIIKYSSLQIDSQALNQSNTIKIYDCNNKPINESNELSLPFEKLCTIPPYVYEAFISIEDKDFYKHKGFNIKRILKASLHNLKNRSFSQGASTITQQLVKNTHLSSEKTLDRKFKELVLSNKIEKTLSKEEILENYLNVIYFGNNCYGISSASHYYFSKPCKDLSLEEGCLLAGMIASPNRYSPITHEDKALKRRNLVLSQMHKDGKIDELTFEQARKKPINLNLNTINENRLNSYSQSAIDEACEILHLPAKQIALSNFKIYTYQNQENQQKLNKSLKSVDFKCNDHAGIIIDNATNGITAYSGCSAYKILKAKRQPGSCLKPLLVYAPSLNEDIINPQTQILDEKITIDNYSPQNINNTYQGYVSCENALSKSINIPSVKVLSYTGLKKSKEYCKDMNIKFDEKDDSYALALGGMTYGTDLKTLTAAYTTFANQGKFSPARFISYITTNDNKLIYSHKPNKKTVFREDTAFLMTEMLKKTAKEGTAKKLKDIPTSIASKTGTVGKPNSKNNLDAWNISYSPSETMGVWCGNLDNSEISIAGGNEPTNCVKCYFSNAKHENFLQPTSVVEKEIDTEYLNNNHIVAQATPNTPKKNVKKCFFSIFNTPDISPLHSFFK